MKSAFRLAFALLLAAVLPARAQVYDFTTLDNPDATPGTTAPQGISGGNIVGCYTDLNGSPRGFLYNGTNYSNITDPHASTFGGTNAQAIDGSSIAGFYVNGNASYSFTLKGTTFSNFTLKAAPLSTSVFGLSGKNLVGSYYLSASHITHGFFYNGTTAKTVLVDDPDSTLALGTYAQGVQGNNVVGFYFSSSVNNSVQGFLFNGTAFTNIEDPNAGPDGTYAMGINNGTIVGFYLDTNSLTHGFIYDGTNYTDLDVPNATETLVYGISNGNIVGRYTAPGGGEHGFFATPAPFPAAITTDPANATVYATGIATFSIKYTGLPIPTIQWQISTDGGTTWSNVTGGNYSGVTAATLTVTNAPLAASGDQFRAAVTNSGGSAPSDPATLTVNPALTFNITAPASGSGVQTINGATYVVAKQPIILSSVAVNVVGNLSTLGNLTYQWRLNNKAISKAAAGNYTVAKFAAANAGNYTVVVHSSVLATNITSSPLTLALGTIPAFTTSPAKSSVAYGANLTLSVKTTGTPAPTLQWQSSANGTVWANLTNSATYTNVTATTLNIFNATTSLQFRAVATNYFGATDSKAATVTVAPPPAMLDPSLQGNYTLGNVTESFEGASFPPATGYAYNVTLTSTGVPAVASAIQTKVLQVAGVTASPKITVTKSTPAAYAGTVSGSLTGNLGSFLGTLGNVSGTENITVVSPGVLTVVFNLTGSISLFGISTPGATLVITGVFNKTS